MATSLHGKNGYAYINGTAIALVTDWSLSGGPSWDDITAMDSAGWGQIIAGIARFSGNITVRYASDDTNGQTVARNNAIGGTIVALRLYPAGTVNYFGGSAGLTIDVNATHDGPDEATYNFESHGAWSYT